MSLKGLKGSKDLLDYVFFYIELIELIQPFKPSFLSLHLTPGILQRYGSVEYKFF